MREALLYEKLSEGKVLCSICQRRCIISPGERGFCWGRLNQDGKLFSILYGQVSSIYDSPIEIKPLFHFFPGTRALSLGSLGCNFRCGHCQNWEIAHREIDLKGSGTKYISADKAVLIAKTWGCQGISWTYNEPTIWFEYTLDSAQIAKKENLNTSYVTNGYITKEALDVIGPYLDAYRVDIKGFNRGVYKKLANVPDFKVILNTTKHAQSKWNMHIEVVTNVIHGFNDNEEEIVALADWILKELGEDTPWHLTQFVPHLHFSHYPSTPIKILEHLRNKVLDRGLKFVYLGNVPGHPAENTYCPQCKKLLIERFNYSICQYNISEGLCQYCGEPIPIFGKGINA
jgi:pyruvate formate lyase activating enzyme